MDMKKIMGTILLVGVCLNTPIYANDITIQKPAIAMQTSTTNTSSEAKLKSQAPKYKNDTLRVYFDFVNNSKKSIQLTEEFRLEYLKNGKWEKVPAADLKDSYGKLDAVASQFPVKPGETNEFGAYIGGYIPRDKASTESDNLTQLPVGKYRVVIKDVDGKEYNGEFELVAEDVFIEPSVIEVKMERPIYDANFEYIKFFMTNHSNEGFSYGSQFRIDKYQDGKWTSLPMLKHTDQKYFPDIGAILPANYESWETEKPIMYERPFSLGKYRVVKPMGIGYIKAEFEVADLKKAMNLPEADKIELTYNNGTKTGKITYTENEKNYRSSVVHELLAFQENKKARSVNKSVETIQVVVKDKKGKSVTVDLYGESESTSAMVGNTLYAIPDPNVIPRIRADMEKLGAFVPSTGETIVQALKEKDVFKNVKFEQHNFTVPFKKSGWLSNRDVSNVNLSIFSYDSPVEVLKQSGYISDNGYSIGMEIITDEYASFKSEEYDWEQPPHYYTAGKCLVMYCGTDEKALTALKEIFGDEVNTKD